MPILHSHPAQLTNKAKDPPYGEPLALAGDEGFDSVRLSHCRWQCSITIRIPAQLEQSKKQRQMPMLFTWLELKNLFQTFEQQDEIEIKQEIETICALTDEDGTENQV